MKLPEKTDLPAAAHRDSLRAIVRIVVIYAFFSALWILFSDQLLQLVLREERSLMFANTLKGLLFVAVTSLLLFHFLLRFSAQPAGKARVADVKKTRGKPGRGMLYLGLALLAAVFALIGGSGIKLSRDSYQEAAGRQLQSIVQLKVTQMQNWLGERYGDAALAGSSPSFNTLLARLRESGDPAIREQLLAGLEFFRSTYRYSEILICDAQGNILLRTAAAPDHDVTDVLRNTIKHSIAGGKIQVTGFYLMRHPTPEHVHLDFVSPMRLLGRKETANAAIVLRTDVESTLYAQLQNWPVPSESAETILFHRDGNGVHHLNRLRHETGGELDKRIPMTDKQLLAAQVLSPDYLPGELIEGKDYRGASVIGAAQPVAGTNWWMLAKIDKDEIYSAARRDALWIVFSSLLTWLMSAAFAVLLIQRRELLHSELERQEQGRQLDALKLLSELTYGSADAIYAKDRQGRYMLFNGAACSLTGKTEDEVIGQDDSALFPAEQAAKIRSGDMQVLQEGRSLSFEETLGTPAGPRTVLTVKGPLHDSAGRIIGLYGISRDISERKASEEKLRRHNEELQRFNRAMIGRELEMIRLKREINQLAAALNQPPPYDLSVIDGTPAAQEPEEDSRP